MDIQWQTACMAVNPITIDNFVSLFNWLMTGGLQTKWWLPPQSVSEGWHLTINGQVHRGPLCGFLVLQLQSATESFALFHHSVCY